MGGCQDLETLLNHISTEKSGGQSPISVNFAFGYQYARRFLWQDRHPDASAIMR
jgi:hypothetical protein